MTRKPFLTMWSYGVLWFENEHDEGKVQPARHTDEKVIVMKYLKLITISITNRISEHVSSTLTKNERKKV